MTGTFLLGLGAEKCGSTWVQKYLSRRPGADFGRHGEYQVWTADLGPAYAKFRKPPPEGYAWRLRRALGFWPSKSSMRWQMQTDRDLYFAYFESRLRRRGVHLTGDVTPTYAALPVSALMRLRDTFAGRGIETRVVFAMRDPVARLRSVIEMRRAKVPGTGEEIDEIRRKIAGPFRPHERYDLTLAAMEAAFPPEARFVTLFEEMFAPAEVARLSDFAGVPADPTAGGAPENARGSGKTPLPEDLTRAVAAYYAPVYHGVAARMPRIAEVWPTAKYVLG